MKRALMTKHKSHFIDVILEDAFEHGLKMAGFAIDKINIDELSKVIDDFPVESYDLIAMDVQINGIWGSNKKRAAMFEKLVGRSKDGALTIYTCDLSLTMKTGMWDKGESHKTHKRNVFNGKPFKVIASYDESIMNDDKAMERIHRAWLRDLHGDSTVHFVEWLTFSYHTYGKDVVKEENLFNKHEIRNFYYGAKRSHIARSLDRMGLNSEKDLVYGFIARSVNNDKVRKVDSRVKEPFTWLEYVYGSEAVCFPYEPIKSDYQVTLRLLEALLFYSDKVKFDDRVNPDLHEYSQKKQPWIDKADESAKAIRSLY